MFRTFATFAGGAIAVFILAAMVVGLMELHNPPPAYACIQPDAPCEGCFTKDGCYYVFHHYSENTSCCWYEGLDGYPCYSWIRECTWK